MTRRRREERGAALLMVLFLLVLATTAGLLLSVALSVDLREQKDDARRLRLAVLVDSALEEALAALSTNPDAGGFTVHDFGGGTLQSRIVILPDGRREATAIATYAGLERSVVAEIVFDFAGPRILTWQPGRTRIARGT
ncbi:MAG: hypothetical protein ABIV06_07960 [Thermoanaerobaculia bacterium]